MSSSSPRPEATSPGSDRDVGYRLAWRRRRGRRPCRQTSRRGGRGRPTVRSRACRGTPYRARLTGELDAAVFPRQQQDVESLYEPSGASLESGGHRGPCAGRRPGVQFSGVGAGPSCDAAGIRYRARVKGCPPRRLCPRLGDCMHVLTLGQLAAGFGHPGLQSRPRRLG